MVNMAGAAYCAGTCGHGVENWDCAVCKKFPNVSTVEFSAKGLFNTACSGFVGYDPYANEGKGSIIVSFTGTDPLKIQNWIDDLDFFQITPTDYVAAGCVGCKVDRGFYYTYRSVRPYVRAAVAQFRQKYPKAPLEITGHSLGGASAVHALVDLYLAGHTASLIYTFGQPRVGNPDFAIWYRNLFKKVTHYRVTHRFDPVPHLPTITGPIGGFQHVPTEVYYKGASDGSYKICDGSGEDQSCSNEHLDLLLTDHLYYVGFQFIGNYIGCKL